MILPDERYEQIKEKVVEMFETYGIKSVPISGFEIAAKMGITVVPYSAYKPDIQKQMKMLSEDGFFVEESDDSMFIFYNDEKEYGRINNTMLHEIGHIVLGHSQESELAEAEVKFFAKYALVPPVLVEKFEIDNPHDIMNTFDVSFEAAIYAFQYYQKWRCCLKEYHPYEKKILHFFKKKRQEVKPVDCI